ncbi:MAG: DUF3098 domain-containing protein, partial [Bacteroidetes bacterium]
MGEKKRKEELAKNTSFIFERKNYKFMLIGAAFITLGFI